MAGTADRTDPKLWEQVKRAVTKGDKGGRPGQWSARKAQLAVHDYKAEGGGYAGEKSPDNHLAEWTREDWGTKSGKPSEATGERYLPKDARERLTDDEYKRTTAKKRSDTRRGKQFSAQPADVAGKTSHAKPPSRAELLAQARAKGVAGRSRMSKGELSAALGRG